MISTVTSDHNQVTNIYESVFKLVLLFTLHFIEILFMDSDVANITMESEFAA